MEVMDKKSFFSMCDTISVSPKIDREFLYELFECAIDGADELVKTNIFNKDVPINNVFLLLYLVNEYGFVLDTKKITNDDVKKDEDISSQIVSIALDKYFTNEHLNYKNETRISKFSPVISNLDTYLNFVLGILKKYPKRNPRETLITDVLYKGFSMAKAISELIVNGFETEAFSLWRTLHETECILSLLNKYGEPVIQSYLKHMNYAVAYRGAIPSKEETDRQFELLKGEMKVLDLKSKDMKKYIEYGWLTAIPDYNADPSFKFNFRNGVEALAGLSSYSDVYEMASEIAHSSPLLIYSRNDYYLQKSISTLYESFFRLEAIFTNLYLKTIGKEEADRYFLMRDHYYQTLELIYKSGKH